jgi:hypothetical protein
MTLNNNSDGRIPYSIVGVIEEDHKGIHVAYSSSSITTPESSVKDNSQLMCPPG